MGGRRKTVIQTGDGIQRAVVIIKPHVFEELGYETLAIVISFFAMAGLDTIVFKKTVLSRDTVIEIYSEFEDEPDFERMIRTVVGKPHGILVLQGKDAVSKVIKTVGDGDPRKAASGSLRRKLGIRERGPYNGAFVPSDIESINEFILRFFGKKMINY